MMDDPPRRMSAQPGKASVQRSATTLSRSSTPRQFGKFYGSHLSRKAKNIPHVAPIGSGEEGSRPGTGRTAREVPRFEGQKAIRPSDEMSSSTMGGGEHMSGNQVRRGHEWLHRAKLLYFTHGFFSCPLVGHISYDSIVGSHFCS